MSKMYSPADFYQLLIQNPKARRLSAFSKWCYGFRGRSLAWIFLALSLTSFGLMYGLSQSELLENSRNLGQEIELEAELKGVNLVTGRLSRSKTYLYQFDYQYQGQKYEGLNFGELDLAASYSNLPQKVKIAYNPQTQEARLEQGRLRQYSAQVGYLMLLGLLIPVIFGSLAFGQIRENRQLLHLYEQGQPALAKFSQQEALASDETGQRLLRQLFIFKDSQGQDQAVLRLNRSKNGEHNPNEVVLVLYDKVNPKNHRLLMDRRIAQDFDAQGHLRQASIWSLGYLIWPVLFLVVLSVGIWRIF